MLHIQRQAADAAHRSDIYRPCPELHWPLALQMLRLLMTRHKSDFLSQQNFLIRWPSGQSLATFLLSFRRKFAPGTTKIGQGEMRRIKGQKNIKRAKS